MLHAQAVSLAGAGGALAVAALAGWRERARKGRRNLDAVGLIAWPTVQILALIAVAICGALAWQVQ